MAKGINLSLLATAAGVIVLWIISDTVVGLLAWGAGLVLLLCFKFLFQSAETKESSGE